MATATNTSEMETDEIEEEKTNSSKACLMLEIATLLSMASIDPIQLGHFVGLAESKVAEIDDLLEDPKSKIIHILEKFRDCHGDAWLTDLKEVVREKLESPSLTEKLGKVTSSHSMKTSGYPTLNKESLAEDNSSKLGSDQAREGSSRNSSASGWDMGSGSRQSHGNGDTSSESFERLSEENVFQSREGDHPASEEIPHQSLDHPEMSLQITKVGKALQIVSDLLGNVEGISQLSEVIPQILRLVRQMKSQKMLRHVFEEENSNLKQDLQGANEIIRELREKIEKLEMEIQDLKKASEDKSLQDFDVVTRREAADMKEEEIQHEQKTTSAQTPSPAPSSEGVSVEAYETLQKKIITLKQKLAQVVKLNHSWDEQYHRMEAALKQELEKTKLMIQEINQDAERKEKERDEILVAAKHRIEELEASKADLQKNYDQTKQQLGKVNRYAVSLQGHKQELETEVKRLNEALEQKLQVSEKKKPVAAVAPPSRNDKSKPKKDECVLHSHEERSILASMTQGELIEELGLLKQQVDVYKSDFYKEQRDRQRVNGEMEEVKTELHRAKKKMDKQKHELQILKDQALAFQFHADERKQRPAAAAAPRRERPRSSPQDRVFELLENPRSPTYHRQVRQRKEKELVPHGVNYALNGEYCDAQEDFQICYPPELSDDHSSHGSDHDPFSFTQK
nr:TNFAIP3-interacting protein 1-like isoform X1 [Lytechinus pictus]